MLRPEFVMNWAHFHLMSTHIPVAGAFLALGAALVTGLSRENLLTRTALQLIVLMGVLMVPAYLSGIPSIAALDVAPHSVELEIVGKHESAARDGLLTTEALAIFALWALWIRRNGREIPLRLARALLILALANVFFINWAADRGHQIRHPEARSQPPGH